MYVDALPDDSLLVSNLGNARVYSIDPARTKARVLIDGTRFGMRDMGNCVVDGDGTIWINEVEGRRVWRFDASGRPVQVLGDGTAGFQRESTPVHQVRFNWIYDIRRGPDDTIYVLES